MEFILHQEMEEEGALFHCRRKHEFQQASPKEEYVTSTGISLLWLLYFSLYTLGTYGSNNCCELAIGPKCHLHVYLTNRAYYVPDPEVA